MLKAKLTIVSENTENIISSLGPEADRQLLRTRAHMYNDKGVAIVEISATDTAAMRAALNSYLECVCITEDINKIIR